MVTNTAGTTNTETPTAKENGECEKNNAVSEEYSSLKQNSNESSKSTQVDQVVSRSQNDTSTAMSNAQNETNEGTSFSQPSSSNGISGNPNYSNRPYGNGLPPPTSVTMNGPPQGLPNASHSNYSSYNHNLGVPPKPGPRPMQGGPSGPSYPPSMQHRYPSNQQPGATPTLNQLLTTPSRYPAQYSSYSNHPTSQQTDFAQAQSQNWQSRPQQYPRGPPEQQGKPDPAGYPPPPQQQQYPSQHPGYPPNHGRYPAPAPSAGQAPYSQTPQYNSGMPPPGSAGYPTAAPSPSRHPSYSGYPNYNHAQQPPYYAPRPGQPQGYAPPSSSQLSSAEGRPFVQPDPQQSGPPSLSQDPMQHHQSKDIMSPTRTPQPGSNPGSVQSPMNATPPSHVHPGYPSVAQLRGQSPAPASPASVGPSRGTPLSPPSVRPGTPLQQVPMRSASEHSEHSSVPGQSPVPGPNYGNYRFHSSQPSFGSQPPVYPPHMISPQHQAAYPSSQQHPAPQHQGTPSMRQPGPPSVGKPPPPMQGSASQSFSQSQPLPAYQQPGYTSSSPAPPPPAERRPSRQGSQPSAAQLPDQSGRQGAAAAAAAAMAAAAHSAQPGAPGQRQQTPNYYPQQVQQQPPQQPQPRPQHPGYNSMHQGNEMYQQNVGYPRMPHPGAPGSAPPHRVMGPPGLSGPHPQGMHRMHPSNQYPSGYPQSSGPPPQGPYPGYYPPNAADPNQPPGVRPGYDQPPPPQEEATKKPAARSASQKLAALFEPADEPGRRDFIERVLRYWEDKDLPLKNAPLMGRKTLDLYRLFQTVKENGGMQEVTAGKKWTDISTGMGLGTASTSGFTLKKQYCKYLYGFECRERGETEPQEALARVTEANRKRKQAQEGAKDDAKLGGIPPQTPPQMHPHHGPGIPGQQYPPQQYPYTGQYPHPMNQQYRQPSPAGTPNYMMNATSGPPHPNMGSYPLHPGHNSGMGPQPTPPQSAPNFPSGPEPSNMYPGPRMSLSSTPTSGYSAQPTPTPVPLPPSTVSELPITKVETPPKSEVKEKPLEQIQPEVTAASEADAKKSIKPPVPTSSSLAAANPFSEPVTSQFSSAAPAPPSLSRTPQQQYPPRPLNDQYRPGFPQRPGTHPSQYPYSNSPVPHPRLPPGPNHPGAMHSPHPGQSASPRTAPGYPPTTPLSSRPSLRSAQYPAQGGSFGSGPYPGMKRSSSDPFGPPSKYARPNGQPSYPNHHYRPETDPMMRQRFPSSGGPPPSVSSNLAGQAPTSQGRLHSSYQHSFNSSSRRGPIPSLYSRHDSSLKSTVRWSHQSLQRAQSPVPISQIQKFQDIRAKRPLQMPLRAQYGTFKRDLSIFPPDSVEATLPRIVKFQRKTCRDVGPTEAWRLVMALKSGLLAESTWALNALTILLYDQQSVGQLKLNQLPGLLDALVEHYRRCLSELFTSPKEKESLGVASSDKPADHHEDVFDVSDNDPLSLATMKPETRAKKKKGCSALSKLSSKFSTMPLKLEPRCDPFLLDNADRWDCAKSVNLSDDLSHIVLSFSQHPIVDVEIPLEEFSSEDTNLPMVVEATLEDVLSIPCSVLSPDQYGFTKSPTEDFVVKVKKHDDKHDPKPPGDPSKTFTSDDAAEPNLKPEKEESNAHKTIKTEENIFCADNKSVTAVCVDKENEKTTEHSVNATSVDATEEEKKTNTEKDCKTNACDLNGDVESSAESKEEIDSKASQKTSDIVKKKDKNPPPICNGLQVNFHVRTDAESVPSEETSDFKPVIQKQEKNNVSVKTEPLQEAEINDSSADHKSDDANDKVPEAYEKLTEKELSLSAKVEKLLNERNVILLEDEAAGSDGSLMDALSGPLLSSKFSTRRNELSNRLQCISNIIRGLSFIPHNMNDLVKQHHLMTAFSGILLLRHKHRTRKRQSPTPLEDLNTEDEVNPASKHVDNIKLEDAQSLGAPPHASIVAIKSEKINCLRKAASKKTVSTKKTKSSELFAPKDENMDTKQNVSPSATVLHDNKTDHIYSDPWWWDMVCRIREDALVILANISPTVDLSLYSDDHVPLAVLEACLHWCTCSSSDACDSFSLKSRHNVSAQKLSLEILTKLSIKDQNVDLILAIRPFSRVEKLLAYLVALICDRRDQILREFAIVLLSNLSVGDSTSARAIALQNGSISGLITFLEECEETGLSNSKLFRQQSINCGTSSFMMSKAAKTLLSLVAIPENKPSFAKHQLRLLSLSMSQLLGSRVTSVISSLLYELSHDTST